MNISQENSEFMPITVQLLTDKEARVFIALFDILAAQEGLSIAEKRMVITISNAFSNRITL